MSLLALIPVLSTVLDRILPDEKASSEAKLKMLEMAQSGELAQLTAETDLAKGQQAINQVEAASTRLFVAGWRPAIGWVCGAALAWDTLGKPVTATIAAMAGHPLPPLPDLSSDQLYGLLFGLLGLGGLRTAEKIKGRA